MQAKIEKVFFKNLDGVRAIAATLVVIWHTEIHRHYYHIEGFLFPDLGYVGVTFFLVLSGFLITYLLFVEKQVRNKVDYKSFYVRRVLRIWPLYFCVLLFGYFIIPGHLSMQAFLLSAFFLPNFAILLKILPTVIDPIWSIGVEEQFYLVQPHILRIKKPLGILWLLLFLIAGLFALKLGLHFVPETPVVIFIRECLILFRYDALLFGSVIALLFYNHRNSLFKPLIKIDFLFHPAVQIASYLFLAAYLLFAKKYHAILSYESLTVVTGILVLNLCNEQTSLVSLNNRVFSFIGKISYGFYLTHKFVLVGTIYLLDRYVPGINPLLKTFVIYACTIGGGLVLASLSYRFIESYFLTLKHKFSRIQHPESGALSAESYSAGDTLPGPGLEPVSKIQ